MAMTSATTTETERPAATSAGEPTASRWRWLGSVVVVLVLAVIGFGGYLVDVPLDDLTAKPVTVDGNVRVVPLSGWRIGQHSQSKGPAGILFTRGGGNLQVVTGSFRGNSEELLAGYVREFVRPQTSRLAVSRTLEQVQLDSDLTGLRVAYVGSSSTGGTSIEGEITAVVSPAGIGAVFNAWAPEALFRYEAGDVDRMIVTAKVR
jgi:hypothetical protein